MFVLELTVERFKGPFRGQVHFNWDGNLGGTAGHILFYRASKIEQYGDKVFVHEPDYNGNDDPHRQSAPSYIDNMFDSHFALYLDIKTGVSFASQLKSDNPQVHVGYRFSKDNTRESVRKLLVFDVVSEIEREKLK